MRPRKARRRNDALHRHSRVGECNVFAHQAVEQHVLLEHDADLAARPCRSAMARSMPSTRTRRLSGSRGAGQVSRTCSCRTLKAPRSRPSARPAHRKRKIVLVFASINAIAERDMVGRDVATDRRQPRARCHTRLGSALGLTTLLRGVTWGRAWWKSCQICARRSTCEIIYPERMLKATSSPTDKPPSITSLAPK